MRFSHFAAMTLIGALHLIIPLVLILWTLGRSLYKRHSVGCPDLGPGFLRGIYLSNGRVGIRELLSALCYYRSGHSNRPMVPYTRKGSTFVHQAPFLRMDGIWCINTQRRPYKSFHEIRSGHHQGDSMGQ